MQKKLLSGQSNLRVRGNSNTRIPEPWPVGMGAIHVNVTPGKQARSMQLRTGGDWKGIVIGKTNSPRAVLGGRGGT